MTTRGPANPVPDSPAFAGFGPRALDVLRAIAFHQDRAWFEENRDLYDAELRRPLEALVASLTSELARRGVPLRGDARSLFRLHRDTRFGQDKRPFKTNAGAVLTPDGAKKTPGLLYIHVDPAGSFAAAGFYRLEPGALAALRRAIVGRAASYRALAANLAAHGLLPSEADALARLPRGFEGVADPDLAVAVRRRHLIVRCPIAEARLADPGLINDLADLAVAALPLLRFGWDALGSVLPGPADVRTPLARGSRRR